MVAESRQRRPGALVRSVVLASEGGVNERDARLWCAARAACFLDTALDQLGLGVPCVEQLDSEAAARLAAVGREVWAIRERLFAVVEEYTPEDTETEDG
jgi:hypothetical protein